MKNSSDDSGNAYPLPMSGTPFPGMTLRDKVACDVFSAMAGASFHGMVKDADSTAEDVSRAIAGMASASFGYADAWLKARAPHA